MVVVSRPENERAVEREIGGDGDGGSNFVRLRFSKEEGEGKIGLGKI